MPLLFHLQIFNSNQLLASPAPPLEANWAAARPTAPELWHPPPEPLPPSYTFPSGGAEQQSTPPVTEASQLEAAATAKSTAAETTPTPTTVRDAGYWEKRRKNNESARRSREMKRQKERMFFHHAQRLSEENDAFKVRTRLPRISYHT